MISGGIEVLEIRKRNLTTISKFLNWINQRSHGIHLFFLDLYQERELL